MILSTRLTSFYISPSTAEGTGLSCDNSRNKNGKQEEETSFKDELAKPGKRKSRNLEMGGSRKNQSVMID